MDLNGCCRRLVLMNRLGCLVFLVFSIQLFSGLVHSRIHVRDSLQWRVTNSQLILVGQILDIRKSEPMREESGGVIVYEEVKVKVRQVLKGDYGKKILFFRWRTHFANKYSAGQWKNGKKEILFFLKDPNYKLNDSRLSGQYVLRKELGDMIELASGRSAFWPVVSMHRTLLTNKPDILLAVKRWVKREKKIKGKIKSTQIDLDIESAAGSALFSGSSVLLVVPNTSQPTN